MSDPIGQTFGSYQIDSLIGRGPNGRVYRARQVRLNRPAALKVLDGRFASAPEFARRLGTAMQRAASLRGTNLVDIEDFGEQQGLGYIAMTLYEDGSLRTLLQQHARQHYPWNLQEVLDLVRQAAEGVQTAHAAGLVHGHIKPENLLLQRRGQDRQRARVSDFGLLELAGNMPIASLTYITPEQARGQTPTAQSDVYALGVVLYEVATGYVPFAVKTAEEAVAKHGSAQPVPPRRVRAELPAELEAIILRCLAKRPEQRFATAGELAGALAHLATQQTPGQTSLLADLPTQALAQPPQQVTQALPIDPANQPTVRAQIDPANQPTVRASTGPRVELLDSTGTVRHSAELSGAGLTVGRSQDNGLILDSEQVSRHHVRIDWDGQQATITDLGAANGTTLEGARLPANLSIPWKFGQTAQIGPFMLRVVAPLGIAAAAQATDPLLQGLLGATGSAPNASAPTQAYNVPAASGAQLAIQLDQEQLTITPGQRDVLHLTVVNNGTQPDSVTVSVEGAPGMWVGVPQQALQLPPSGRAPLALTIGVPRDSDSLAGDYPVIIRARSSANPGESATARGRWTVLPFVASSLSITPRRLASRRDASFQVTIRNDGNQPGTFLLNADDEAQELRYSFSDDSITLEPGQAETVGLNVAGRSRLIGGADSIPFQLSARAADERPSSTTAQFVSEALLPPALPIILLALVGLGLLYFLLNGNLGGGGSAVVPTTTAAPTGAPTATPTAVPGAPLVNQFVIDPPVVQPGQAVTILWNVGDAATVDINVLGTGLPPQGQASYVVNETTDIVLQANNGGQAIERRIQAIVATPVPATAAPTSGPTALPTAVPTTVPTGLPTAAPPTAAPPTAAPTTVPPTAAPPATSVPVQDLDVVAAANTATWSNNNSQEVAFGKPAENAEAGGWAETPNLAQLEGNLVPIVKPLYTVPLSGTGGFVAGSYQIGVIGKGQHFFADVGFANNTKNTTVKVQVLYNGEVLFEQDKQADGKLLTIDVDLANFVGTGGALELRVENTDNPSNTGLYWVNPRVAAK